MGIFGRAESISAPSRKQVLERTMRVGSRVQDPWNIPVQDRYGFPHHGRCDVSFLCGEYLATNNWRLIKRHRDSPMQNSRLTLTGIPSFFSYALLHCVYLFALLFLVYSAITHVNTLHRVPVQPMPWPLLPKCWLNKEPAECFCVPYVPVLDRAFRRSN